MAESRLIRDYRAQLDELLPPAIAEELADGLQQTYHRHLSAGLGADAAARAALAEFGDPAAIATAFADAAPGRRAARTLLCAGPAVGGCWAAALIGARAWDWPISPVIALALAAALATTIALLLIAAFGNRYRVRALAASAALVGLVGLDLALPGMLVLPGLLHGRLLLLAAGLSLARAGFATRTLHHLHAVRSDNSAF